MHGTAFLVDCDVNVSGQVNYPCTLNLGIRDGLQVFPADSRTMGGNRLLIFTGIAVNSVFISSTNQLGEFETGITAAWGERLFDDKVIGAKAAVVAGGIGTLIVVISVALYWPRLRKLGPLHALNSESGDLSLSAEKGKID